MKETAISRYCALIEEINELRQTLSIKRASFYDGGHSFEECYSEDLEDLDKMESEFLYLHTMLASGANKEYKP